MIDADEMKSQERLRHNIEEELASEPSVDAAAIGVALEDGVITLSGQVASHAEKVAAERAASRVHGVKAIVSELEVKLPATTQVTDQEIARETLSSLSWNTLVPPDRVKVRVENGWITLEGDVEWQYQKNAAYDAVCNLKGVKGVINKLAIKPLSVSTAFKTHIEAAFRRRFGTRMDHVTVETSGDHVTLRGAVASLVERAEIERVAWTTPGVCHVNNDLSVSGLAAAARRRNHK